MIVAHVITQLQTRTWMLGTHWDT